MPDRFDYLADLRTKAYRSLPASVAEALVSEATEHLAESVQARLDLGDLPTLAERDAVAAFGKAATVVAREAARRRARFQSLMLACTTVSGVGWAFTMLASPELDGTCVVVVGMAFFSTFGAFVRASETRRPLAPVLVATFAFWLGFAAICAYWVRDYRFAGWLSPRHSGPIDLARAALWSLAASGVYLAYLLLAYRMVRPSPVRHQGDPID